MIDRREREDLTPMVDPSGMSRGTVRWRVIERVFPMTSRKLWSIWALCLLASWVLLNVAPVAGFNAFSAETVSGIVSYQGQPLPHGLVSFSPEIKGEGSQVYGLIEDGHYILDPSRFEARDHSVRYRVSVTSLIKGTDGRWKWTTESPNDHSTPSGYLVTLSPFASQVDINLN
jgi:hypothetical protein